MKQLFSTVYVSSATALLSDETLTDILRVSRTNNQRDGITGMLLYRDGNIMQALEGPKAKVEALIDKLRHDERHQGVQLLVEERIAARQFDKWAMAFEQIDSHARREGDGLSDFLDNDAAAATFRTSPAKAHSLLLSFRNNIR